MSDQITVAGATLITSVSVLMGAFILGAWVSSYSRGYNKKSWHRPLTAAFVTLGLVLLALSGWLAAVGL